MDIQYLLTLQHFREITGAIFDPFFLFITKFGEGIIPYFIVFFFYWCVDKRLGQRLLLVIFTGDFVNSILKLTFCVYRPWVRCDELLPAGNAKLASSGYSFPSGHTTSAAACYGTLAWTFRSKKTIAILLVALLLLVGFSRNYLGVHTPQDVLCALLEVTLIICGVHKLLLWINDNPKRIAIVALAGLLLIIAAIIYVRLKTYPLDYVGDKLIVSPEKMQPDFFLSCGALLGVLAGWFVERKFVNFSTDVGAHTKAIRFISGAFVYIFMVTVGYQALALFCGAILGSFLFGPLTCFYCVAVHPMMFRRKRSNVCLKIK
ncbi:MAG: phosphatase PAP2 family protein [Paludibacter sp.]|jgi:membrane-associated phospholipid phosphatase|nr:phosphatase PAP2 family protein [Paludibacter sp.]